MAAESTSHHGANGTRLLDEAELFNRTYEAAEDTGAGIGLITWTCVLAAVLATLLLGVKARRLPQVAARGWMRSTPWQP